jgi:hypothetical protein
MERREEENLMSFDHAFFWSHINRARQATDPYFHFDSLWKAFNVYYESFYEASRNNQEHELIRRAMERVPTAKYQSIFAPEHIRALTELDPIYDEKLWHRFGNKDKGRHIEAQRALRRVLQGEPPSSQHLHLLVEVLYVVRCNLFHGFKTPERQRDQDVLMAAGMALAPLVEALSPEPEGKSNFA